MGICTRPDRSRCRVESVHDETDPRFGNHFWCWGRPKIFSMIPHAACLGCTGQLFYFGLAGGPCRFERVLEVCAPATMLWQRHLFFFFLIFLFFFSSTSPVDSCFMASKHLRRKTLDSDDGVGHYLGTGVHPVVGSTRRRQNTRGTKIAKDHDRDAGRACQRPILAYPATSSLHRWRTTQHSLGGPGTGTGTRHVHDERPAHILDYYHYTFTTTILTYTIY